MAFTFNYAQALIGLERTAESQLTGRFSWFWSITLAILRSRYLLISLLIYAFLLMILGGVVVGVYVMPKGTFENGDVLVLPSGPPTPPPPGRRGGGQPSREQPAASQPREVAATLNAAPTRTAAKTAARRITTTAPSSFVRVVSPPDAPLVQMADIKVDTEMAKSINDAKIAHFQGVAKFQEGWVQSYDGSGGGGMGKGSSDGVGGGDGSGGGGSGKKAGKPGKYYGIRAKVYIYQAKYQDGDWACNGGASTNYWELSSLKNFMYQITQWSNGRIDAQVLPLILDIGSQQLFTLRPPFVYMTGHKDFHFTDQEVKNLRDYLTLGGCLWADSALAGRRSRFDVAFRREIKKVLPDRDFEIVPPDHEMFNTFFANVNVPSGMNFYNEPVEMINLGEELAVLYTLNGYGHFWESRLDKDGKIQRRAISLAPPGTKRLEVARRTIHSPGGPHLYHQNCSIIYRNITDETVRDAYKFGINVVVHLLTRYEKHIRFLPKELPKIKPAIN